MAIVTVKIDRKKDLSVLQEILNRFGLSYNIDKDTSDYAFSESELKGLLKTKQDFSESEKSHCYKVKRVLVYVIILYGSPPLLTHRVIETLSVP